MLVKVIFRGEYLGWGIDVYECKGWGISGR